MSTEQNEIPAMKTLLDHLDTYESVDAGFPRRFSLCDPVTQICKRLEGFLKGDPDIKCSYMVNNNHHLDYKRDPDTNEPLTKKITYSDGETVDALVSEDHIGEFRVFVSDVEKAEALANVIRHRHVYTENYLNSDDQFVTRDHYLVVRVFTLSAIDPMGSGAGADPWISDDDTDNGLKEIFGLEPINWDDTTGGCQPRLAPSDTTDSNIPKGVPEEYEQIDWEQNPNKLSWKWKWLKTALKGNKNVISSSFSEFSAGGNVWRFIECSSIPVIIHEDNLTSLRGHTAILPEALLSLVFSTFGKFQISTYARVAS